MSQKWLYLACSVFCLSLVLTIATHADILAWWRFDEGSGDVAYDSSGNGHDATVQGTPAWTDGPEGFGGAMDFSNTVGANCADFDPTGGTGVFTLTLWCLWDGTQSIQHRTRIEGFGPRADRLVDFLLVCHTTGVVGEPVIFRHFRPTGRTH